MRHLFLEKIKIKNVWHSSPLRTYRSRNQKPLEKQQAGGDALLKMMLLQTSDSCGERLTARFLEKHINAAQLSEISSKLQHGLAQYPNFKKLHLFDEGKMCDKTGS